MYIYMYMYMLYVYIKKLQTIAKRLFSHNCFINFSIPVQTF